MGKTKLLLWMTAAGVLFLVVIGEIAFQYVLQSGWETYFPSEGFDALAVSPQGQVWAHHQEGGFAVFDGKTWREQPLPANSPLDFTSVSAIAFDHQGRTWIGTSSGIGMLDGNVWTSYTTQNSGLKDRLVEAIVEDRQQQIWIGTSQDVEVFAGGVWRTYSQPTTEVPGAGVVDMAVDSRGRLWLGLRGSNSSNCQGRGTIAGAKDASGVSMYDGTAWTSYSWEQMGLKGPYSIQAIAVDKQDQLWVGTNGGLHVFDGKLWKTVFEETQPFDTSGPAGDKCIEDIAVDPQGKIWILMGGGRLGIFDGEKWLRLDDRSVNLPDYSKSLAIDPGGRAWFASSYDGLRSTPTAQPAHVPSRLFFNARYGLTLALGASFWMFLGLAVVVGSMKPEAAGSVSRRERLRTVILRPVRFIVFGAGIGFLVALVGGGLHGLFWLVGTGGDISYSGFDICPTFSFLAGPGAGVLAGIIFGLMARHQDRLVSERSLGIVIGAVTGAWYGIFLVVIYSLPGAAVILYDPYAIWLGALVLSFLQALIGMLFGLLGSFLFLRKASSPPSV